MTPWEPALSRRTVLAGLVAGGVGLSGCGAVTGGSATKLRVGTVQPPVTLDPVVARDVGSAQAINRIFDGLYTYGSGTDIVPQLAESLPSQTGDESLTVTLDVDARFHDGQPVTASDVRYSFEAPRQEDGPELPWPRPFAAIEAVDDRTVRFVRQHSTPLADHALTRPVVPKQVREADSEGFGRDPVGTGPYQVQSFEPERAVELSRWEGYGRRPAPVVDRVSLVHVASPITQLTGLVTNRTDAIEPISPRYRDQIRSLTGASVAERPGFRSLFFGYNLNEGPTTDPAVREGIARSIDLDRAVDEFVTPVGQRQPSTIPQSIAESWGLPVDEWADALPSKDITAARRAFERAGVDVGKLTILTAKAPVCQELAEALASGLRDARQSVVVDAVGWKQYLERSVSGAESDYAVFVGQIAGNGDPDSFLYPVFHENEQGVTNGIFYNEEPVMNQLLEARRTTDRGQRRALYERAVSQLLAERTHLPICSFANSFALDPAVRGLRVHPIAQLNPRVTRPDGVVRVGTR